MPSIWETYLYPYNDIQTTAQERRDIIADKLPSMIRGGLNQSESKNVFRNVGLGIKDSDFGTIYNSIYGHITDVDFMSSYDYSYQITEDDLKLGSMDFEGKYKFIIGVTSYDIETDTYAFQQTSLILDYIPTPETMLNDALEGALLGNSPPLFQEILEVRYLRGMVNPFSV